MQELKMGVTSAEEETQAVMKVYSKEDYSVVNRFESKTLDFIHSLKEWKMHVAIKHLHVNNKIKSGFNLLSKTIRLYVHNLIHRS